MIPGVKGAAKPTKQEAAAFHESEANCNTCQQFRRRPGKTAGGLMQGHCGHHPYGDRFVMVIAPDDWMGMRCWQPRRSVGRG